MIRPALTLAASLVFGISGTAGTPAHKPEVVEASPMALLPASSRSCFVKIMFIESRSTPTHLNATDYNPQSGAGGIFQFLPWIWDYAQTALGFQTIAAQFATVQQQFEVAAWYWTRNGGPNPEWAGEC